MTSRYKVWLVTGALFGCLAVVLGAFGAHGLEGTFQSQGLAAEEMARKLANWKTAAEYQMYHALALLAVGLIAQRRCGLVIHLSGAAMTLGTLIFSGCLYALVLSGVRVLGAIVPIGGTLMIVGWALLLVAACLGRASDGNSACRVE